MRKLNRLLILAIAILTLSSINCTLSNPLSELSWGTCTVQGRVTRLGTQSVEGVSVPYIEGVSGAMIKTDSGTEQTFTDEQGYYSITLTFRIGSAAKEKKVKISAFDMNNSGKSGSASDVVVRDGLIIIAPPITWSR